MSVPSNDLRRLRTVQRRRQLQLGVNVSFETENLHLFVRVDEATPPITPEVQWAADPLELPRGGIGWNQVVGKSVEVFKGTWEVAGSDGDKGVES